MLAVSNSNLQSLDSHEGFSGGGTGSPLLFFFSLFSKLRPAKIHKAGEWGPQTDGKPLAADRAGPILMRGVARCDAVMSVHDDLRGGQGENLRRQLSQLHRQKRNDGGGNWKLL